VVSVLGFEHKCLWPVDDELDVNSHFGLSRPAHNHHAESAQPSCAVRGVLCMDQLSADPARLDKSVYCHISAFSTSSCLDLPSLTVFVPPLHYWAR
jgi:hypothetical protein